MSVYDLTPQERRARALAAKERRENRYLYQNYVKAVKQASTKQAEAIAQARIDADNERRSQPFLVRAADTVGDLTANIITGAVKGIEGIVDLGIGIVGGVGGIFSKEFQNQAKDAVAYDWTMETFGNAWREDNKYSYLYDNQAGGVVQNVASGVGQMLPAVAVAVATAGIGTAAGVGAEAAQAAGQTASLVTLGVSAAGNSTEQAFQDGADYWRGLGYGVASGLVEVATEKMFGGATKALTGAGWLDDIALSAANTGAKRIALNALEEGAEEMASELVNPTLKAIYKGADAFNEYKSADYWKGVGEAGLVGSLTALAYSGTVGYGMSKLGQGYVGKEADIADSLSELNSLKQKQVNLQDDGRYTEDTRIKVADVTKRNYENIERTLKSVSAEKRAKLIEKFSLQNAFNADGSMSEQLTSMLNVEQPSTQADGEPSTALASGLNHNNYSVLSQGNESRIMETIEGIQESARESAKKANPNITAEELEAIKIESFNGELQSEEASAFTDFKKFVTASNKLSGLSLGWAVVSPNKYFNAAVDNEGMRITDGTIIISADNFQNGKWAESVVHEELHTAYGTKQWANLYNALIETTVEKEGKKVKAFDEALASIFAKDYGFDVEKVKAIQESVGKGVELSAEDRAYIEKFEDELGSHMAELALGNEKFIAKFIGKRVSLAEKFLNKIADLKSAFERIGNAEARAEYKQLQKAEKLYIKAIESAGGQYINRKIIGIRNRDIDDRDGGYTESTGDERNETHIRKMRDGESVDEAVKSNGDTQFSLKYADDIADNQERYIDSHKSAISRDVLESGIEQASKIAERMKGYESLLPQDKIGKTVVKNGSYDKTIENTTICVRTLAYNEFVNKVQESIKRPLSQMESFLVSQKLYDIATEPQCLYCYVSLDRKAYNEYLLRYFKERDRIVEKYKASDKTKESKDRLYQEFLNGRKDTPNMRQGFSMWIETVDSGKVLLTESDVSTDYKRARLAKDSGDLGRQFKHLNAYAQNASHAKLQQDYVAYYDDILRLGDKVVKDLNAHYGLRWYSFSDFSGAFILENMQQITDASIRGLKGLAYTKDTDFAEIFAPTGMNINISVFAKKVNGEYQIDESQSAELQKAIELRDKYSNVGIVVTATDNDGVEWALAQKWSDVVIPFHIVRSGQNVAEFYKWSVFNSEQSDTVQDKNLWQMYLDSIGKTKASAMIYPSEHNNDLNTFLRLAKERGVKPRFSSF